jgi:hypothetical protein
MKVASGKVVAGQVVVEGAPLEEGSTVTVIAPEGDETFELNGDAEAALLLAIDEAERGEVIDGKQFLSDLASRK